MAIKLAFFKLVLISNCFLNAVGFDTFKFNYETRNKKINAKKTLDYRRLLKPQNEEYVFLGADHPYPLPKTTTPYVKNPSERLYQGFKRKDDVRVFNKKFDYEPDDYRGQQFFSEGLFDCILTHLSVETTGGIPILLRGGVGYRHFSIMCKAKTGRSLIGRIRAYCKKPKDINGQYSYVPAPKNLIKLNK